MGIKGKRFWFSVAFWLVAAAGFWYGNTQNPGLAHVCLISAGLTWGAIMSQYRDE